MKKKKANKKILLAFKRLNGGRALTKSQLRLLGLKKIKLTSEQATNGIIKTMCEGLKY